MEYVPVRADKTSQTCSCVRVKNQPVTLILTVCGAYHCCLRIRCPCCGESRRRARDSRAPPVDVGADGCDARALSAQPTAIKSLQIHELPLR